MLCSLACYASVHLPEIFGISKSARKGPPAQPVLACVAKTVEEQQVEGM